MASYKKGDIVKKSHGEGVHNYLIIESVGKEYRVMDFLYFENRGAINYYPRKDSPRFIDAYDYPLDKYKVEQDKTKQELIDILFSNEIRIIED